MMKRVPLVLTAALILLSGCILRSGPGDGNSSTGNQSSGSGSAAVASGSSGGGGTSNFGTVTLTPGFTPDPHVVSGISGGSVNASQHVNAQCRGWVSQRPDHIFMANGQFNPIRFVVRAGGDTTLVVANDHGRVWCDDDGGEGTNPMVNAAMPAGRYRVWIGSYQQGQNVNYRLGFSELSSVSTSSIPSP